jgi:hypothetical protein
MCPRLLRGSFISTALLATCLLPWQVAAKNGHRHSPSVKQVCAGLTRAAFGLCNAFCKAQHCQLQDPESRSCRRLRHSFERATGRSVFPCEQQGTPTSTATDTPVSTPTDTPPAATATETPTGTPTGTTAATLTPTDTPVAPTDTPTQTPTDTVAVTATPTDTPTETPTGTPTGTTAATLTLTGAPIP